MQQWVRQVGKILTCNTKLLEVFARGEHFHPLAFLEKQFPLNWIEKCKMTLYVWITATGWLPKQSTTVNKVGNIIIAAISDHRERIVAASRKGRNITFEGNKFLIFPAMESHRRELMGLRGAFKKRWSWECSPVCMCNIHTLLCDRKCTGMALLVSVCWYNADIMCLQLVSRSLWTPVRLFTSMAEAALQSAIWSEQEWKLEPTYEFLLQKLVLIICHFNCGGHFKGHVLPFLLRQALKVSGDYRMQIAY